MKFALRLTDGDGRTAKVIVRNTRFGRDERFHDLEVGARATTIELGEDETFVVQRGPRVD